MIYNMSASYQNYCLFLWDKQPETCQNRAKKWNQQNPKNISNHGGQNKEHISCVGFKYEPKHFPLLIDEECAPYFNSVSEISCLKKWVVVCNHLCYIHKEKLLSLHTEAAPIIFHIFNNGQISLQNERKKLKKSLKIKKLEWHIDRCPQNTCYIQQQYCDVFLCLYFPNDNITPMWNFSLGPHIMWNLHSTESAMLQTTTGHGSKNVHFCPLLHAQVYKCPVHTHRTFWNNCIANW